MSIWIIIIVALALVSLVAFIVPLYLDFHITSDKSFLIIRYARIRIKLYGGPDKASEIAKAGSAPDEDRIERPSRWESRALSRLKKLTRLKEWDRLKKWAALTPKATSAVANLIWRILRNIKVESLRGEVSGGFSDPALTGIMLGWSSAILGAIPALGRNISIRPDFDAEEIQYDASGMIRLSPFKVAGSFLRFLIEAPWFRIIKLTLTRG